MPPPLVIPSYRRGTGLVRTLVVASATLAILLVCFSIYQYSQSDSGQPAARKPRLPPLPAAGLDDTPQPPDAAAPGVPVSSTGGSVGAGERVGLTLYGPEGDQARMELTVSAWTPVRDRPNEFLLNEPEVRMRTEDGHAVRLVARRGWMEARRRGGGISPQRGRLSGHVRIQYDRLTEDERKQLPPERRDTLDPDDLIEVETDELEFDLEYAKLVVPDELKLRGRDVRLNASGLTLRFNERANRVQSLRIDGGGELVLIPPSDASLDLPAGTTSGSRLSLLDWLRTTLRESIPPPSGTLSG
ncbi:MAG: hypothetical protein D6788_11790, partial [Planctomycetota bacterium]